MNNKFRSLVAMISLTISGFSAQLFAESVEQFLAKQTNIRVNMSGGPNFGDQANTYNVMNHLRELGFTGKFEIVYDNKIKDKMITLFDLPANFPDIYEDNKQSLTFIEAKAYFDSLKQGLVTLDDVVLDVGKGPNPLDGPVEANAKANISFSSYFDPRGGKYNKTYISLLRDNNYSDHQANSGKKFFIFPVSTYEQAHDYLFNNPMGQAILAKKPGFIPFLNGLDDKKFNALFVYGRTLRFTNKNDELYGSRSPSNVLQVIAGARYAQLYGRDNLKPVVIAVFYDYQTLSKQLLELLKQDQWGDFEQSDADIARQALRELKVSSALSAADLNDAASIDQINNLQPGQILLLSIGPLPKIIFDGLYNHTASNIWPQVYEGAATFSALNFTGRPRFECADTPFLHSGDNNIDAPSWTLGFEQIQDAELKQRMQSFYSLEHGFCGSMQKESDDNFMTPWKAKTHEALGRFIIEAMDEHSAFSAYFSDVKKYVLSPESDRTRYALEEIIAQNQIAGK